MSNTEGSTRQTICVLFEESIAWIAFGNFTGAVAIGPRPFGLLPFREEDDEEYRIAEGRYILARQLLIGFRSAQDLAAVIFDLDEYQILEFPETGHWAVSLPKEVRDEIWKTTSNRRDTIVERLRRQRAEAVDSEEELHAEVRATLARLTRKDET